MTANYQKEPLRKALRQASPAFHHGPADFPQRLAQAMHTDPEVPHSGIDALAAARDASRAHLIIMLMHAGAGKQVLRPHTNGPSARRWSGGTS